MPNTLAHIGVQGLLTRSLIRGADVKWIFLGLVIPDLPWILFRALSVAGSVDPYTLRLYAIGQSSLVCCLLVSAALAAVAERPRLVFATLALNSLVHLLLDACQMKLANGVHLLTPFSWNLVNFGLFWPEGWPTYAMTVLGLAYFLWTLRFRVDTSLEPRLRPWWRPAAAVLLGLAYLLTPLALQRGLWIADSHFVRTLSETEQRPGHEVEFDRNRYLPRDGAGVIVSFAGEEIGLVGSSLDRPGIVSVRGRFIDEHTVAVLELHEHAGRSRDLASYAGLILVLLAWVRFGVQRISRRRPHRS